MSATQDFIKADFGGTLFPLKTNLLLAERHEAELSEYIYQKVLDDQNKVDNWAAAGFKDTLLRWSMKPEVVYGNEKEIQPRVQA